jgi:hypothetical protein
MHVQVGVGVPNPGIHRFLSLHLSYHGLHGIIIGVLINGIIVDVGKRVPRSNTHWLIDPVKSSMADLVDHGLLSFSFRLLLLVFWPGLLSRWLLFCELFVFKLHEFSLHALNLSLPGLFLVLLLLKSLDINR